MSGWTLTASAAGRRSEPVGVRTDEDLLATVHLLAAIVVITDPADFALTITKENHHG